MGTESRRTWIVATMVGAVALVFRARALPVVEPSACPGVAEVASTALLRAWPRLTLGSLFQWSDRVALVIVIAAFVAAARALRVSWPLAAAMGLALAAGPLLQPTFAAPTVLFAFACCAGVARGLSGAPSGIPKPDTARSPKPKVQSLASAASDQGPGIWPSLLGLAVVAVAPQLSLLAALIAAFVTWRARAGTERSMRLSPALAAAAASVVVMASAFVAAVLAQSSALGGGLGAPIVACMVPDNRLLSASSWLVAVRQLLVYTGPAVVLLALVAVASAGLKPRGSNGPNSRLTTHNSRLTENTPSSWLPALVAVASLALATRFSSDVSATLAPTAPSSVVPLVPALLVAWLLAALALERGLTAFAPRWRLAATALVLVVGVWLQGSRTRELRGEAVVFPRGHERLSGRALTQAFALLPAGASIVSEDAGTDLLLHAVASVVPEGGARSVVPNGGARSVVPDQRTLADALERGPVFALPHAQGALQALGVAWEPIDVPVAAAAGATKDVLGGIARVVGVRECLPVGSEWAEVTPQVGGTDPMFAVNWGGRGLRASGSGLQHQPAREPALDARLEIYLASSAPLAPSPLDWPARSRRGFWRGVTDMSNPDAAATTMREMEQDGLRAAGQVERARFITRIDAWRTPGAPLSLAARVGGTPERAWARLTPDGSRGAVLLCPSAGREPLVLGP